MSKDIISRFRKIHGNEYDYSKVEYVNTHTKICITCHKHGEFYQEPNAHLHGQGCPFCAKEKRKQKNTNKQEDVITRAKSVHGDKYDYSHVNYKKMIDNVEIICPIHGSFFQTMHNHLKGYGCPQCGRRSSIENRTDTTETFIAKSKIVHGDKYDYSNVRYIDSKTKVDIICPKHGLFTQRPNDHLCGKGCSQCAKVMTTSNDEDELFEYVNKIHNGAVLRNYRSILKDNREIDIYIPSLKVGIEFDGLYWHSEINQPSKNYHLLKTEECAKENIRLIHVFEDEWKFKKNIVKSRIANILNKTQQKVYARKCCVKEIDNKVANDFLEKNHIQGRCISSIRYGLFYKNDLISVMTFGKLRKNLGSNGKEKEYELLRFCNKNNTTVIGGASKLFKHFVSRERPNVVMSYADRRWSNGNLYDNLGFRLTHISKPSYFYIVNHKRKNRFCFRKDILVKEGFDKNKTEHETMLERGIYRIYDCGCLVYRYRG